MMGLWVSWGEMESPDAAVTAAASSLSGRPPATCAHGGALGPRLTSPRHPRAAGGVWQIAGMTPQRSDGDVRRQAGWLPEQDALESWLAGHRERVEAAADRVKLHPVILEFQTLIATDPVVRMYVERMISQVPEGRQYSKRHLTSSEQMLRLINAVLSMAPEFGDQAVTLPLGAILDWTMGTSAGVAAYRDPRINAMLKKILTAWCEFLDSADSRYVLNDSPTGWKSAAAQQAIGIQEYEHDPADPSWGFGSWNDFFTRRFTQDARPVASLEDDKVIVSACE